MFVIMDKKEDFSLNATLLSTWKPFFFFQFSTMNKYLKIYLYADKYLLGYELNKYSKF